MDRFDLHLSMTRLSATDLMRLGDGEPSDAVRERVEAAREVQRRRYGSPAASNASVSKRMLVRRGAFVQGAYDHLRGAIDEYRLTGRGVDRVLRVARTVADLRGSPQVEAEDVRSALGFRYVDDYQEDAA